MFKRRGLFCLALLGMLVGAPLAWAAPSADIGFKTEKLKNGLTLVYKVMKDEPMVSVYAVVPIGMNGEKAKGIAHLLEHLVFRGGSGYTFTDIADVTGRQGGQFNGFTTPYATSYNYVVPKDNFGKALKVFNGSLWKTDFSEQNIALERKIVTHEKDMDYSLQYAYYPIMRYFYPESGYTAETVGAISATDMKEFHMAYYQPGNATYVIAGDFDPNAVIQELEQVQNGYGKREAPKPELTQFKMPGADVVESRNIYPYQFQLLMAYEFNGLSAKDRMILNLLSYSYGYDYKINYERNLYKIYNVVARTIGAKDYFGIYYLERNQAYSEQMLAEEKANLQQYTREFRKMNFKQNLRNLVKEVEIEGAASQDSAVSAVEYRVQKMINPESITLEDLPVLKKITEKDLEHFMDTYLSKPPTTWILVKTTK